jgi:hypothetical protein
VFKNLKMLLSLRAWWKSGTLNLSAVLGAILAADISTGNAMVMTVVEWLSGALGLMTGTALALLLAIREVLAVALRAKTERALNEK